MIRSFWILLLIVFACSALAQERIYVVQSLDESLGEINLGDQSVNRHVVSLGYGCNDIVSVGERLYVTNSLYNTVQEIDAGTNATLREMSTAGGVNPYSLTAISSDTLAVTNWVSNNITLLRLSDGEVAGSIAVGVAPEGILACGDSVYVCLTRYLSGSQYGPGAVMVFDRATMTLVDSIQVGCDPQWAGVDPQGRLHVVCTGDYGSIAGSVYVVDRPTLRVDTVLNVGGTPSNISFGGGFAFIAAGGWGQSGQVFAYRLSDLAVIHDTNNPLVTGPGAYDIEAMPDGSFFVSCFSADKIECRTSTGLLLHTYNTSSGPGQMVRREGENLSDREERGLNRSPAMFEAYPNPFNGVVRLQFDLSSVAARNITIYNSLGQAVDHLQMPAGVNFVTWIPEFSRRTSVSSGIYYVYAETGQRTFMRPLVYLR